MRRISLLLALAISFPVHAEIYNDIGPFLTLGQIRQKFPQAQFRKIAAAWVTKENAFFAMSGVGLSGDIYLAFTDERAFYAGVKEIVKVEAQKIANATPTGPSIDEIMKLKTVIENLNTLTTVSEDDGLYIDWVRWVPATGIPLARYVSKYGAPGPVKFSDTNMQPYLSWPSKGLIVKLSDDQKLVTSAEYSFTVAEKQVECTRFKVKYCVSADFFGKSRGDPQKGFQN